MNCYAGESIQQALAGQGNTGKSKSKSKSGNNGKQSGAPGAPIIVVIRGICNENVDVRRNAVTLRGESPGDGISVTSGTAVRLWQVSAIGLEQLTITGGGSGTGIRLPQETTANMAGVRVSCPAAGAPISWSNSSASARLPTNRNARL